MKECLEIKVGDYRLGGLLGMNPTVLFGTIFFEGQQLLLDSDKGVFNEDAAFNQISESLTISTDVSVPVFLDIVADTEDAISNQIDFIINQFNVPFLVDGSDSDVRIAGLKKVSELYALERTVYNSIGVDSPDEEFEALIENPPAAIIVSAIDTSDYCADSALEIVRKVKERLPQKLHNKLMLDIGFLDEASVKMSCLIGKIVRKETGLPVGGAPCNGLQMWDTLKARGDDDLTVSLAATLGFCTAYGMDFLFAGPLRFIKYISPAQGTADIYNRYNLMISNRSLSFSEKHPMNSMFRNE
jgi:tetrahydromethanopterin S-methyltransferase subunit H